MKYCKKSLFIVCWLIDWHPVAYSSTIKKRKETNFVSLEIRSTGKLYLALGLPLETQGVCTYRNTQMCFLNSVNDRKLINTIF